MRVWNNVKTMEEVVNVTNILMRDNIKFFMEHNNSSWGESITIVITSRNKEKIEKCKKIGFVID